MKQNLTIILLFILYLVVVISLILFTSACRQLTPVNYADCNINLLTDKFVAFSGIGLITFSLLNYIRAKFYTQKWKDLVATIVILSLISIVAFYLYLPLVFRQTSGVEIFLDTL